MKKIIWGIFIVLVAFVALGVFLDKKKITNEDIEEVVSGMTKNTYEKMQDESRRADQKYNEYVQSGYSSKTVNNTDASKFDTIATKNWLTYTNSTYSFSIKYPKEYKVVDNSIYAAPVYFMTPETSSQASYFSLNVHEEKAYCRLAFYTGTKDKVVGMNRFRFMDFSPLKMQTYFLLKGEKCYQIEIEHAGLTKEDVDKQAISFVSTFKLI